MKELVKVNITILLLICIMLTACGGGSGKSVSGGDNQPTLISIPELLLTPATPISESLAPSTPVTYQETILYKFVGGTTDGANPQAALIEGSDGNFYGTTKAGGAGDQGTVFKITPLGVESLFYSFGGGNDGAWPNGLIQGSDGNFYGTTQQGGANNYGTVFKITSQGVETVLYRFAPRNNSANPFFDGVNPFGGLIQFSSDGSFYGTTYGGGVGSYGTVFQLTSQRVESPLYSFAGGVKDGANPQAGLIQGSDGNFYGTTYYGGANESSAQGAGTVFKITPQGVESRLYSFADGIDGARPYAGLIQGSDGNFYGTTLSGGAGESGAKGYGTVFKITPQGQETILYRFTGGKDGATPLAGLIQATTDGNFYGTTLSGGANESSESGAKGYGTVFQITPQGQATIIYRFTGGPADGANPYSALIQGSDGNFYGTTYSGGGVESGALGYGTVFKISIKP